jgi:hypothetical protein
MGRIVSVVKKLGKELSRETEMLGSYPPKTDFASTDIGGGEYMEAPTGMLARGEYKAEMRHARAAVHRGPEVLVR